MRTERTPFAGRQAQDQHLIAEPERPFRQFGRSGRERRPDKGSETLASTNRVAGRLGPLG